MLLGMRLKRAVVVGLCGLVSIVGCGNDDSGGDEGSNGGNESFDWSDVNPPPNIDIDSCYDVTYDGDSDPTFSDECRACCMTAGFNTSSSINDDHCTCGDPPDDGRDTVCAAEADQPTVEPCMTCCTNEGFSGYTWVGGGGPSGRCVCHGTSDSEICAPALDHPVPDESCFYCCLENGYLSAGYANFAGEECTCIAP